MEKTNAQCAANGCKEEGTFAPYDFAPNVRFCDKHAIALIGVTVRNVLSEPDDYASRRTAIGNDPDELLEDD